NLPMPDLFIGLISGTSPDGLDAALVECAASAPAHCRLPLGRTHRWAPALRPRLVALRQGGHRTSLDELGTLDVRGARAFARAATALRAEAGGPAAQVRASGSRGQTVRHRPRAEVPFTLQLGDGATIAEGTGITTVDGLRQRDVAAGGQGAPLLPGLHAALLVHPSETRAVLNLGGIANLTLLPAGDGAVGGFDTGPANALLDAWCE